MTTGRERTGQRVIKFRVWLPSLNFMGIPFNPFEAHEGGTFRDEAIFMQFTGLHDKNGVEIYEGDVVDLHPEENDKVWHRQIVWDTAAFHCVQIHGKANHPLHFTKHMPDKAWVVIGNIYQNPELLKR